MWHSMRQVGALLGRAARRSGWAGATGLEVLESRVLLSGAAYGNVDILNRSEIVGWAYSPTDGAAAETVEIDIDSTKVATLTANQGRADLQQGLGSAYHGFAYNFASTSFGPGDNTLQAYVVDSAGNRVLFKQATMTNPKPYGNVDFINSTGIAGWAYDPDNGASPTMIRVDVNGVAGQLQAANYSRPDLAPYLGDANHGFYISGDFTGKIVDVWVQDNPSGQMVLIKSTAAPLGGNLDYMNSYAGGWAYSPDVGSGAVEVRVDVDGVAGTPVLANMDRPDLASMLGSGGHGFAVAVPAMDPGTHDVKVYAINPASTGEAPTLIEEETVTNHAPYGNLDVVNTSMVAGWAFDKDVGSSPIQVTVYVDQQAFATVTANMDRPDLASLGSTAHGFMVDMSSMAAGPHEITVTLHDNQNSAHNEIVLYDDMLNSSKPYGSLDVANMSMLAGWAYNPDYGSAGVPVDVYVDNVFSETITANAARPDLAGLLGSANHGFVITTPALGFGTHTVDIYAAEAGGTLSDKIGSATITHNRPYANIDVFNSQQIIGWAFAPDMESASVTLKLAVDGVVVKTQAAGDYRGDLTAIFAHSHGYTFTLGDLNLTPGSHEIDLYIVDPNNGLLATGATRVLTV